MKILHETLGREQLHDVTFIIAGQQGIYSRLTGEDPSTERLVRHVPISTLDPDEARYVLQFAADNAEPPFAIEQDTADMLLAMSAGYPYDIHLLGDAAFTVMAEPSMMTAGDVLRGLQELFRSDKREKYVHRLQALTLDERLVVVSMSRHVSRRIPLKWSRQNLLGKLSQSAKLADVLEDSKPLVTFSSTPGSITVSSGTNSSASLWASSSLTSANWRRTGLRSASGVRWNVPAATRRKPSAAFGRSTA